MSTDSIHNPSCWVSQVNSQDPLLDYSTITVPPLSGIMPPSMSSADMLTALYLASAAKSLLVPTYKPSMYINSWLHQYCTEATLAGVPTDLLGKFLCHYLPPNIAEWICTFGCRNNWEELHNLLISTYGLDLDIEKAQRRQTLQATTQRNLSIWLFQVKFATLVNDMPNSGCLSNRTILNIFLKNIKPPLCQLIEPTLNSMDDWETVYEKAVMHEDCIGDLAPPRARNFHCQFEPMDCSAAIASPQRPKQHSLNDGVPCLWGPDGRPICGYCKGAHWNKDCPGVSHSAAITYQPAIVKEESPLAAAIMPAWLVTTGSSQPTTSAGPSVPYVIQNKALSVLVDTGSTITAIRASALEGIVTKVDCDQSIVFNTAAGAMAHSHGTVSLPVTLLGRPLELTF
ncbi:hypothetical protein PHYBLDRAFT_145434 [Phycomyces blakesleeanus NRRL 1555(-)]|uniref:Uncharacterized protein n=1 Tax=Phycomyces blakesleeanus (strain ATCC 8743b / DSM 1359 / FGSC 10004 / NBRC 33097 / NRRL 1555) TaxID=763407 RepID=A0A163AJV1_PHYB8|nr:hypothetical protein PHYBLDRAFT_145434 [Phycomyces blakesleeanus NRRL 1555(-)]OAD73971.1 hypothetical protein PHYBLDRAFT_145434 [Phycomyces blakesleeanus NRRL 1555(-)]|eukprot:XP_018292011.1 hypothetical protein PHYBLDRAFT_145434 [Phycomyces blakesleeanus NRRL 1555(-)]